MRTPQLFIGAALIALVAPAAFAKTQPKPHKTATTPQQMLQALYHKMDVAGDRRDLSGFLSLYSPRFAECPLEGHTEDMAEFQKDMAEGFRRHWNDTCKTTVLSVTPLGNDYIVVAESYGTYDCHDDYTGQVLLVAWDETDQDYWTKSNGKWQIQEENEVAYHYWEDGHKME